MNLSKSSAYKLISKYASENSLAFAAVYGSFHKGTQHQESDIDLIIDSYKKIDSDTLKKYEEDLSSLLNQKVELITPRLMISSLICGYVWRLKEYETIFGSPYIKEDLPCSKL